MTEEGGDKDREQPHGVAVRLTAELGSSAGDNTSGSSSLEDPLRCLGIVVMTIYFVALYGGLVYLQFGLWRQAGDTVENKMTIDLPGMGSASVTANTWLLILILSLGAIGSFVHAATSFADYVGNKRAQISWVIWFLLRPFIGSSLALIIYVTLRGGLFSPASDSRSLNIYGFAAIAGMSGMFAKQATDKLREVFDNLFRTAAGRGDDARDDKLKSR
jgi:hypothetical protein